MAESVVLTKNPNGDYLVVTTGIYDNGAGRGVPQANYHVISTGVKLCAIGTPPVMHKYYAPEEWTVGVTTGFTTNKEVTDAITALSLT